ncbi:topoisomerase IV subunit A [Spiroplasma sp. TIUS-1]|uniref:DNA topoisomerase IV subunit A n=1 Tax=Spiroplasma sp. TIUS-1 TaxID=216963 RepID=UPI001397CBF3|nr:DNA topoisomerase IV subunit A [Spiroplasma sp. TIUS-1]QHX35898.1 topoisomerase IV subunit A [Spiroplasma sp. TIUS-1]
MAPKTKKPEEVVIPEENIIDYALDELMGDRFGRYAKYIIQERALPDVRDGLKPVQRRILYTMNEIQLFHDKAYKKSARVVGEVIGKYHPHGDTSIYEALVRMSQYWKLNVPLSDMHGNNGSIDGDSAAAMRYTEVRLSKTAELLLRDLKKNSVQWAPNFDDSETEPTVLPAYFPNILVNGSTGIAAGYATNIPPHNFNEILDATIRLIERPHSSLDKISKIIKGPDFPTGGVVMGKEGILEALATGRGRVVIQSKTHIEDGNIIITEIPYEIVKQDLVKKIGEAIEDNPQMEIKDIRDETDRNGLRIVIELNKDANVEIARKWLLKNTPLQVGYNYNNVVIVDKRPQLLGMIDILKAYINHLGEVFLRKTKFDLVKAEKRLEIVKGLVKAVSILDQVIEIIRKSTNRSDAIEKLISKLKFSEVQAIAIVDLRLYRLSSTDVHKLTAEAKELENTIKHYKDIISDKLVLDQELIELLTVIRKDYGVERRTEVIDEIENIEIDFKETIVKKDYKIWISKDGYIKSLDQKYIAQNKLTQESFARKPHDMWISTVEVSSLDNLILVCSDGTYYLLPAYKISESKWKDIGMHINKIAPFSGENHILAVFVVKYFENAKQEILIASKKGMIKRVPVENLETKTFNRAFKIINLGADDEVVSASLVTSQTEYVVMLTKTGFTVKYDINEIPSSSPSSKGVKSTVSKNEDVVAGRVFDKNDELFIITERGGIKRIKQTLIPVMSRPKRGVRSFPVSVSKPDFASYAFNVKNGEKIAILDSSDVVTTLDLKQFKSQSLESKIISIDESGVQFAALKRTFIIDNGDIPPSPQEKDDSTVMLTANISSMMVNGKNIDEIKTEELMLDLDDLLD